MPELLEILSLIRQIEVKKPLEKLPSFPFYAICLKGYEPFLEVGKAYKVIRPEKNDRENDFRVVDAEDEDYLYPRDWFVPIALLPRQKKRVAAALSGSKN